MARAFRDLLRLGLALGLGACSPASTVPLPKEGGLQGQVELTPGSRGDVWLFLYGRGEAPPRGAGRPRYVTAVPDGRLARRDARFVFGALPPNPYELTAFLDADRNFATDVDVLAQPGAGDRLGEAVSLNLQPGEQLVQDVTIRSGLGTEPPAFRVDGAAADEILLPDQPLTPTSLELAIDPLAGLSVEKTAFRVSLLDQDADGRPDDEDGDGLPDLSPRVLLVFEPRPGQEVPKDVRGRPAQVIVPLVFNPGPFLAELAGKVGVEVAVDRLQVFLVPQAQAITVEPGPGRRVQAMDAIPVGEYRLVVLTATGQSWWLPNDLAGAAAARLGGPFASQGTRFRFVHGTGLDGGS